MFFTTLNYLILKFFVNDVYLKGNKLAIKKHETWMLQLEVVFILFGLLLFVLKFNSIQVFII